MVGFKLHLLPRTGRF